MIYLYRCPGCSQSATERADDDRMLDAFREEVRRLSGDHTLTHDQAIEWLQQRKD